MTLRNRKRGGPVRADGIVLIIRRIRELIAGAINLEPARPYPCHCIRSGVPAAYVERIICNWIGRIGRKDQAETSRAGVVVARLASELTIGVRRWLRVTRRRHLDEPVGS